MSAGGRTVGVLSAVTAAGLVLASCGSSAATTSGAPSSPPPAVSPAPSATSPAPSPSPTASSAAPTRSAHSPALATGAKSASCVNGWVQPAPGSDFYRQAVSALEQNRGGSGHQIAAVRYFAGPLAAGGLGAVYYLDVRDPQLSVRVVLVSAAGPAQVAAAPSGTHGWKDGDWTGFRGQNAPASHPPLPGTWSGPEYDPVSSATPLLSPQLAGCMAGT